MVGGALNLVPTSEAEISTAIAESKSPILIAAHPGLEEFGLPLRKGLTASKCARLSLSGYRGIVEHDVSDQVVVVRAGTTISDLQAELALQGQCLPLTSYNDSRAAAISSFDADLCNAIAYNLPHDLFAKTGSWRDWILGMKIVLADGTVAKCGSKAVKNVAGYDAQKLMTGARHTLALIIEVTFKTFPLKAMPSAQTVFAKGISGRRANWIQRVQRSDFDRALTGLGPAVLAHDPASSTLWAEAPTNGALPRIERDWLLRSGAGSRNIEFKDIVINHFMNRAKDLFDPDHKLNPGGFGLF